MGVTDHQVRKLMQEYSKTNNVGISSARAGMSRKTGSKYLRNGKMPSAQRKSHTWRTRKDPFSEDWEQVTSRLADCPELESKALFEWLCDECPGRYHEGQLRTFQRRVRLWRAAHGPDKEVFFPQEHRPGKRLSTDFTHMDSLGLLLAANGFRICYATAC